MAGNLQHQGGQQHMNQWQETSENVSELQSQPSAIPNQTIPMTNTIIASHGRNPTELEMMTNTNVHQIITRNEPERVPEQNPPQVRKISRFQVSHVKEEEKSKKLPNIVHGGDILLENISPEQKQAQIVHEMVPHNLQSPSVDNSPDKLELVSEQSLNGGGKKNDCKFKQNFN